jgi:hypothetical protein
MVIAMAALLRIAAALACAIIVIGFMAFANDEASRGSEKQVQRVEQAINEPAPGAETERAREGKHSKPRELIDDANDVLLSPFAGLIESKDAWVRRLIPGALALLVYGLGLTLLANFLPQRSGTSSDWRTAT